MAYIIMKQYDGEMRTVRAKIKVITTDSKFNGIPDTLRMEAEDFLEMYKKYASRIVINGDVVKYTGSIESDIFNGSYGNSVKGLKALRTFGMKITKEATRIASGK